MEVALQLIQVTDDLVGRCHLDHLLVAQVQELVDMLLQALENDGVVAHLLATVVFGHIPYHQQLSSCESPFGLQLLLELVKDHQVAEVNRALGPLSDPDALRIHFFFGTLQYLRLVKEGGKKSLRVLKAFEAP